MHAPRSPSFARDGLAAQVLGLGKLLTPELVAATTALYAPLHAQAAPDDVLIERDLPYGPHPRHRLDVFRPVQARRLPVLIFVHGGGFVGGDKAIPGTPFHANVGTWAARNGVLGIVMTYRLAPEFQWPGGAEDVGAAVGWARANVLRFGGDPARVHVMGHSAGAAHLATYLAGTQLHAADGPGIAGAALISGLYNTLGLPAGPNRAYYGDDPARYAERAALPGLARCGVPLLVAVAENDPAQFEAQALELLCALHAGRAQLPRFVRLSGHNHISITLHLGCGASALGAEILDFIHSGR